MSSTEVQIPEGFTPWSGGAFPVSNDTEVEVVFRNGALTKGLPDGIFHNTENLACDIIAYRVVQQKFNWSFGLAIGAMKAGQRVARTGWNGKGLWLELQRPDSHSKMTLPYIYLNYPDNAQNTPGARVPWLASQTDVLADDWGVVE